MRDSAATLVSHLVQCAPEPLDRRLRRRSLGPEPFDAKIANFSNRDFAVHLRQKPPNVDVRPEIRPSAFPDSRQLIRQSLHCVVADARPNKRWRRHAALPRFAGKPRCGPAPRPTRRSPSLEYRSGHISWPDTFRKSRIAFSPPIQGWRRARESVARDSPESLAIWARLQPRLFTRYKTSRGSIFHPWPAMRKRITSTSISSCFHITSTEITRKHDDKNFRKKAEIK